MSDVATAGSAKVEAGQSERRGFALPPLAYDFDGLEPTISEATLRTHYAKHHAKYVENVNRMIGEQAWVSEHLEDIVRDSAAQNKTSLFNNAAQAWNHGFFWASMSPHATSPDGGLADRIESDFGDLDTLRSRFIAEGAGHFASGWVWLVAKGDRLSVISTHDAETTTTIADLTPLLVCDVWEHAYYLDYRQDRAGFLAGWWDKLANWQFAQSQYEAALGRGESWRYPTAD